MSNGMALRRSTSVRMRSIAATFVLLASISPSNSFGADECPFIGLRVGTEEKDVTEGDSFEVIIERVGLDTSAPLEVILDARDGNAFLSSADFVDLPRTLTIPAGEARLVEQVSLVDDAEAERGSRIRLGAWLPPEQPQIALDARPTATNFEGYRRGADFDDNDTAGEVSVSAPDSVNEGQTLTFRFERRGGTAATLLVYRLETSAAPGLDFEIPDNAVQFPHSSLYQFGEIRGILVLEEGADATTLDIPTVDDTVAGENEDLFYLTLLGEGNYRVGTSIATVELKDNDQPSDALPRISVSVPREEIEPGVFLRRGASEGGDEDPRPIDFVIERRGATDDELTVNFALKGMAINGVHYQEVAESLVIEAGEHQARVTVTPIDDSVGTCFMPPPPFGEDIRQHSRKTVVLELQESDDYEIAGQEVAQTSINDSEDWLCLVADLCASASPAAADQPLAFSLNARATRNTIEKISIENFWDFGGGECESSPEQGWIFEQPGTYTVSTRAYAFNTFDANKDATAQEIARTFEIEVGDSATPIACSEVTTPPVMPPGPSDCAPPRRECGGECVDPQTSPAHCGSCGNSCDAENFCSVGMCTDKCDSELTTCGQSCVDLDTSVSNCGACGQNCEIPGAQSQCQGGECILQSCLSGRLDVDGDPTNGCECLAGQPCDPQAPNPPGNNNGNPESPGVDQNVDAEGDGCGCRSVVRSSPLASFTLILLMLVTSIFGGVRQLTRRK